MFLQGAGSAAWTFPSVLGSAMLIAWAAEASQFLIVICSPNAARSQYVNEEIRLTTRAYNAALERLVLRHPEQWFWVHRRWKDVGRRKIGRRSG